MQRSKPTTNAPSPINSRRAQAAILFAQGVSAQDVARRLSVSLRSIYPWRAAWRAHGIDGLRPRPRTGRPPMHRLSESEAQRVRDVLAAGPTDGSRWTLAAVRLVVEQVIGKPVNAKLLRRWLRERLDVVRLPLLYRTGYRHAPGTLDWTTGGYVPRSMIPMLTWTRLSGRDRHLDAPIPHPTSLRLLPPVEGSAAWRRQRAARHAAEFAASTPARPGPPVVRPRLVPKPRRPVPAAV